MIHPKNLFVLPIAAALFSCNSGSTSKQESTKITEAPQVSDTADFQNILAYKNISFDIKAMGKGSLQQVTIQPNGLSLSNDSITIKDSDPVVNAEVADLNGDNFPELLIYTQSAGSGSYGQVQAYSVNNGKSLSAVYFPPVSENPQISKGYMGHDQFKIADNKLTQSFPLYNVSVANSAPTGKQRIITYKLVDGEASRKFVVDKVTEQ